MKQPPGSRVQGAKSHRFARHLSLVTRHSRRILGYGAPRCASVVNLVLLAGLVFLLSCGGGSSTTTTTSTSAPVNNTVSVAVNSGPANNAVNTAYVTVEVCNPGSTTTCATIPDVQVDTGSSGLRILASAPGVSGLTLSPVSGNGTPVNECVQYNDGSYIWGPVLQANVVLAGETASNLPIQVIDSGASPLNVPSTCAAGGGSNLGSSTELQANGILGIGPNIQDCGASCSGATVLPVYWLCAASGCTTASVPTATQVSNPVSFFNADNNGVLLTMNSVAVAGAPSASGTLTFGIGTQSDNAMGNSVKVYGLSGNLIEGQLFYSISAGYNGNSYPALLDTGETFNYFLEASTVAAAAAGAGIVNCPQDVDFYCPSSTVSLPFTAQDKFGDSSTVTLSIGNATSLLSSSVLSGGSNAAVPGLAGGLALGQVNDYADLGMPFFYGRTVYVGISGEVPPSGVALSTAALGYWAF